jgi:GlcNAc-PI de-N-acetylase
MRILAIGSHPDDIELGCGATLLRAREEGASVTILVLTDGRLGPGDPEGFTATRALLGLTAPTPGARPAGDGIAGDRLARESTVDDTPADVLGAGGSPEGVDA